MPGMYAVTSMPFESLTLATFRRAEFGFFGVVVNTLTHTPLFCGLPCKAGALERLSFFSRPFLTSWFIVGIPPLLPHFGDWNISKVARICQGCSLSDRRLLEPQHIKHGVKPRRFAGNPLDCKQCTPCKYLSTTCPVVSSILSPGSAR